MMNDPLRRLSAPELVATALPPRQTLLDPILTSKTIALLYGPRGLGKTFVALGLARAAAAGESFLGWRASRPHNVLYLDGEMAALDIQQRIAAFGPPPATLDFILADLNRGPLIDLAHGDSQRRLVKGWGQPELVVIDNLATLAGLRDGDPDRWHELQRFLMRMRQSDIAVLMVHHANKHGLQRGTSKREDVVDMVMALRRPADGSPADGARFEIHFEKTRGLCGAATRPVSARLDDEAGRLVWHWQPVEDPVLERATALVERGADARALREALGVSRAHAYRLRRRALQRLGPNGQSQPETRT